MTVIRSLEAIELKELPIAPLPFRDEPRSTAVLLVRVVTESGIIGYSLVPSGEVPYRVLSLFINECVAPEITGLDVLEAASIWQRMCATFLKKRPTWLGAIGSVDVAIWDAKGKALGKRIASLLDAAKQQVSVYVAFGVAGPNTGYAHLKPYGTDELVQEALFYQSQGHLALKTGVGRGRLIDLREDTNRLAAIREAVGPSMRLMIDASCKLTAHEAATLVDRCRNLDLELFEEPIHGNDAAQLNSLRQRNSLPIAANPYGPRQAYLDLLLAKSVDVLQPNVATIGFTESVAVAELCKAFRVSVMNGNGMGPLNLHLQAGMSNATGVEYNWIAWETFRAVFDSLPDPIGGYLDLPDSPGLGLELREGVIEEHGRRA